MIRYSGYPVQYQEILFDNTYGMNNFVTVLLQAGWTWVRNTTSLGYSYNNFGGADGGTVPVTVLQSQKTPQGLQCRLWLWMENAPGGISGLAMPPGSTGRFFLRFYNVSETATLMWPFMIQPRPTSMIRIIANPYQFFSFKYSNVNEFGNCAMGGVPYIPGFMAPFKVVSAVNHTGTTILLTLSGNHNYSGDLVCIEGAQGATGLDGTFNATAFSNNQVTVLGQLVGSYVANSAVLAGPDRLSRMIWCESSGYITDGSFGGNAKTFRDHLDSAPSSGISSGAGISCNSAMVNQYSWVIANSFENSNLAAAVRLIKMVPYQFTWYDGNFIAHEPYLTMGEVSNSNESRVCAQLWDAAVINNNFGQLDKTIQFDGKSWFTYTVGPGNPGGPDGSLVLRISN